MLLPPVSAVPTLIPPSFSRLKQSDFQLGRAAARCLFLAELTSCRVHGQGEGHRRRASGPAPFLVIGNRGQRGGYGPSHPAGTVTHRIGPSAPQRVFSSKVTASNKDDTCEEHTGLRDVLFLRISWYVLLNNAEGRVCY